MEKIRPTIHPIQTLVFSQNIYITIETNTDLVAIPKSIKLVIGKLLVPYSISKSAFCHCSLGKDNLCLFRIGLEQSSSWNSLTNNLQIEPKKECFGLVWLDRVLGLCILRNENRLTVVQHKTRISCSLAG